MLILLPQQDNQEKKNTFMPCKIIAVIGIANVTVCLENHTFYHLHILAANINIRVI